MGCGASSKRLRQVHDESAPEVASGGRREKHATAAEVGAAHEEAATLPRTEEVDKSQAKEAPRSASETPAANEAHCVEAKQESLDTETVKEAAGDEDPFKMCTGKLQPTMTCTVEGPLSSMFGALPIDGRTLSVAEVNRCDLHRRGSQTDSDASDPRRPSGASIGNVNSTGSEISPVSPKTIMQRLNTLGSMAPSKRDGLVNMVEQKQIRQVSIDEGQTGTVFALEVNGEKIAVFKPATGEQFDRRGVSAGQGAVREEAAYLADRLCGSQAGVPVTSRASMDIDGETVPGSVQAFCHGAIGFIEDFGIPRDPVKACEFVTQEAAEALALLDMRCFNMDRHPGNLLLLRPEKPHGLGPIDHGCCFPPWYSLGEAIFDAWLEWPQLTLPPSSPSKALVQTAEAKLPELCQKLAELGLDFASIVTLRLCTLLLRVAVVEFNRPIGKVATLMCRDPETGFEELSWLEQRVKAAAEAAGVPVSIGETKRREQMLQIEGDGSDLNVDLFLTNLEEAFRKNVPEAIEHLVPNLVGGSVQY
eukprot:TRINITY_DN32626_c0_g1_i2.p1 TRINITY_DN32626_c0_g1~~TRINITY_DN32626_c0_g1_i2.p1  ORF type:complete len:533 (+),score=100.13 TRINITY_DN32626_c0_g1_i2:149-1747(+)